MGGTGVGGGFGDRMICARHWGGELGRWRMAASAAEVALATDLFQFLLVCSLCPGCADLRARRRGRASLGVVCNTSIIPVRLVTARQWASFRDGAEGGTSDLGRSGRQRCRGFRNVAMAAAVRRGHPPSRHGNCAELSRECDFPGEELEILNNKRGHPAPRKVNDISVLVGLSAST